jgi:hypothetical protein
VTKASGSGENSIVESVSNGENGIDQAVFSSGSMNMKSSTIASDSGVASSQKANLDGDIGYIANRMTAPSSDIDLTASFSGLGGYSNTNIDSVAAGSVNVVGSANIMGDEYFNQETTDTLNSLPGTILRSIDGLYLASNDKLGTFGLNIMKSNVGSSFEATYDMADLMDYKWPDLSSGPKIKIYLNTRSTPTAIKTTAATAIEAAKDTWDGATSKQLFVDGISTTTSYNPNFNRPDKRNVQGFSRLGAGTIAVTGTWYYTDVSEYAAGDYLSKSDPLFRAFDSDCIYNTAYPWVSGLTSKTTSSTAFELKDIALHELGHTLGFPDFYDALEYDYVMYGYRGYNDKSRPLTSFDKDMLRYLYGGTVA